MEAVRRHMRTLRRVIQEGTELVYDLLRLVAALSLLVWVIWRLVATFVIAYGP